MKILISGTHSTAKTTLCQQISKLLGIKYLPEKATELYLAGFVNLNKECTFENQKLIMNSQLNDLKELDNFVSDRGLLDSYAYGSTNNSYDVVDKFTLFQLLQKSLQFPYDLIFISCPLDITIENDGIRNTEKEYQLLVHDKIIETAKYLNLEVYYLNQNTIEQRVNFIIDTIRRKLAKPAINILY